jgi:hypothetical protein
MNETDKPVSPDSAFEDSQGSAMEFLKRFCGRPDEVKWAVLLEPFSRGSFSYATNGHLGIRVPRIDSIPERTSAPNLEGVFAASYGDSNIRPLKNPLPDPIKATQMKCAECGGRGTDHPSCPTCKCECQTCDGTGSVTVTPTESVSIGDRIFDAAYIRKIASLPGLMVNPEAKDDEQPIAFRFDGGEGLLMPLRTKQEIHLEVEL